MKCTVRRNGKELGEFTLEDAQTKVVYGALREGDEFRYDGTEEWKPISALPPCADQFLDSRSVAQMPGFWVAIVAVFLVLGGAPFLVFLFRIVWRLLH